MSNLFWLSDAQMERLKPFFPNSHGKPRVGNRRVLSGIIFINRNGLRWCDAPKEYGPHKTLYTRVAISDVAVRRIISSADTFFIATLTNEGADVSHRGGMPGALHQNVDGSLSFPDYAGNQYFNTLGNIEVSSRAGLFIPDFASGEAILLTGKAGIDWSPARAAEFEGAERVVDIHPEDVWYARHALPRGVFTEE